MGRVVEMAGLSVVLADPVNPGDFAVNRFVGREEELRLCRAAWNIAADGKRMVDEKYMPLNFRLEGPPGVGKNEIVYRIAKELGQPLYIVQGHEELTPEDLALLLVPNATGGSFRDAPLVLRASPLATAIYVGGLCFFDEINRVPDRALSPLASVLDSRRSLYSAMTGIHILPDENAVKRFRFCCALNPALSAAGQGVLPDYIEQRTLPAIKVDYMDLSELSNIVRENLQLDDEFVSAFERWFEQRSKKELSVRQALTVMNLSMRLSAAKDLSPHQATSEAADMVVTEEAEAPESDDSVGD